MGDTMAQAFIQFMAGCYGKERYVYTGRDKLKCTSSFFGGTGLRLSFFQEVEVATEESVQKLGGSLGTAIAGGILLGGVGALAGAVTGGKGKEANVICTFTNGAKALAKVNGPMLDALQKQVFEASLKGQSNAAPSAPSAEQVVAQNHPVAYGRMLAAISWILVLVCGLFIVPIGIAIPLYPMAIVGAIGLLAAGNGLNRVRKSSGRPVSLAHKTVAVLILLMCGLGAFMNVQQTPEQKAAFEAQSQAREAEKAAKAEAEKAQKEAAIAAEKEATAARYAEEGKGLVAYLKSHIKKEGTLGGYKVEFTKIDQKGCEFSVFYEKGSLDEENSRLLSKAFVLFAARYYAENGRKPSSEGMRIIVRVFTPEKRTTETHMVSPYGYAYYKSSTDELEWEPGANESLLYKMFK